jgi:glycosyltransferase involved in cell wall biosynthesis
MPSNAGSTRRIGIVNQEIGGWMGGPRHIKTLTYSLGRACESAGAELFVFGDHNGPDTHPFRLPAKIVPVSNCRHFPGEARVRRLLGLSERSGLIRTAREHGISVLLPFLSMPVRTPDIKTICWIPDFQHIHLAEFFPESERRYRDQEFLRMTERCTLLLLSSRNAFEHFKDRFSQYVSKVRITPFPSLFAFEPPTGDPATTIRKFNLPDKFALVANQFWRHKNHEVVIEAIRQVHRNGIQVPLVMTGLPMDYRDRNNEPTTRILQAIAHAGLNRYITVLGMVNDVDFGNIIRSAAVVIQPSLFEGWSTAIQDCKALGRPLICSDIPVHREQAKEIVGYFRCDGPDELAALLAENWSRFDGRCDLETESRALAAEREFARAYGEKLFEVCREAAAY